MSEYLDEREQRVTPLELFFDLVFAFGFTQVTTVFSDDPTWAGLAHGLLILGALWWAWAGYAWLTNAVDPNESELWAVMLVATGAMFVAALAVPEAFGEHGVVFGVAFLVVIIMFLALYALGARGEPDLFAAILRIAPSTLAGAALIVAAGFAGGGLKSTLWVAALVVGFLGGLVLPVRGWRVRPAHFVERHGLIVIIAIGESLIGIGIGARATELSAGVIVAALLGLLVATSFWFAYFDFFPIRVQQLLSEATGARRIALARDVFTYLHLPIVAGIVLFAFAMKTTLAHVSDELDTVGAVGLCGGSALVLFAFAGIALRVSGRLGRGRTSAGVACVLLIPVATAMPALVALALVSLVWIALHAYELIWWREERAAARALRLPAVS